MEDRGILVGADESQEWLLPWWWKNFRRCNVYPVAFADFGLSKEMRDWCRERGELIEIRTLPLFVKDRDEVSDLLVSEWESVYPNLFWSSRKAWFKKPLACLQSPFDWTVWMDSDCEVTGSLEGIWEHRSSGMSLVKDSVARVKTYPIYNSGVVLFQKNHPLIAEWAKESVEKNGLFRGDQDLLSLILAETKISFSELPSIYNRIMGEEKREGAVIVHWAGDFSKKSLRKTLILTKLLNFD